MTTAMGKKIISYSDRLSHICAIRTGKEKSTAKMSQGIESILLLIEMQEEDDQNTVL
jgi:hypothetical protein